MSYQHTQSGTLTVPVFIGLAALLLIVVAISSAATSSLFVVALVLGVIGVVLAAFNRLTVTVEGDEVDVRFRWGWPARRIDLAEVHRIDEVRNKWWYGFGVRLLPHGWMYNVWGLDAVQLNFNDGQTFRIGTDQPTELAAALEARLFG